MMQRRKRSAAVTENLESLAGEILVFPRAVELAIEFGQFYKPSDPEVASELLDEAASRLQVVEQGGSWAEVVGLGSGQSRRLLIGGYQSKIDGSYQPYGLVVPSGLDRDDLRPRRLDLWFHGRGETLSEVSFLSSQRTNAGQYTPDDTIVIHPYGRYCNAFKFAGEIDVLEVLDYVKHAIARGSGANQRARLLDGGSCLLAVCHALCRSLVRREPGCRLFGNSSVSGILSRRTCARVHARLSTDSLAAL